MIAKFKYSSRTPSIPFPHYPDRGFTSEHLLKASVQIFLCMLHEGMEVFTIFCWNIWHWRPYSLSDTAKITIFLCLASWFLIISEWTQVNRGNRCLLKRPQKDSTVLSCQVIFGYVERKNRRLFQSNTRRIKWSSVHALYDVTCKEEKGKYSKCLA